MRETTSKSYWHYFAALILLCSLGGCRTVEPNHVPVAASLANAKEDGPSPRSEQNCAPPTCKHKANIATPFVTIWNTENPGITDEHSIRLPLIARGNYNFRVDWGDGKSDIITHGEQPDATHRYATPGQHRVTISGLLEGWSFDENYQQVPSSNDALKLIEVANWGALRIGAPQHYANERGGGYFSGAENLRISATDMPVLGESTSLHAFFEGCSKLTQVPSLNQWDVSSVTDMKALFSYAERFNQDIGAWDVSSVTNMAEIFAGAGAFNQAIGDWNVSSVTDMSFMFYSTKNFDQNISAWDTSSVTTMKSMFQDAKRFNQNIGTWDVSSVTDMSYLFSWAERFDQDISAWDVSSVTDMKAMFYGASQFNQDISGWDVSSVTTMQYMFGGAKQFDQNIGGWDVSSVTNMTGMFMDAALSTPNYDSLLIGWSAQNVQPNITFDAGASSYSAAAVSARSILTNPPNNWTIIDAGQS